MGNKEDKLTPFTAAYVIEIQPILNIPPGFECKVRVDSQSGALVTAIINMDGIMIDHFVERTQGEPDKWYLGGVMTVDQIYLGSLPEGKAKAVCLAVDKAYKIIRDALDEIKVTP